MKTIHLFRFNDSIFRKIPFFKEEHRLKTDVTDIDLMNIEIVTEYIIKTYDDFSFDNTSGNDLLSMCKKAQKTIEHYFVIKLDHYDFI
ncbi:heme oxygenase [Chryseobacterium phosphatilyticum]|uniref:Heme oxygenase n=1 Tax=Chryseobacterium phosphatilyticum TaxID=475075 RepID=A0A316XH53_9FLAO|nr:heme oxygenase [Chryseobacterium phosphatilyticum]PWN72106.1 heme oxygenase [Chryseobacterium phosphatilyticum]